MQTDPVVIEILTQANLGGLEQAKTGLLGMNTSTMVAAAGLGLTVKVGEEASKVYENHEKALNRLKQAVDTNSQSYPAAKSALDDFIARNQAFIPDNNKAIDSYALLTRSTGDYRTALQGLGVIMNLAAISPTKDWDASTQAVNMGLQGQGRGLKELGINIAALKSDTGNATDANKELTKAQNEVERATRQHDQAARSLQEYQVQIGRPGHRLTTEEMMRLKDHQDKVGESAVKLQKAHEDVTKAQKDLQGSSSLQVQVLRELQVKTADGTNSLTEQEKARNNLNAQWQEFANKTGPGVVGAMTAITKAADTGLGIISTYVELLDKMSKNPILSRLPIFAGLSPGTLANLARASSDAAAPSSVSSQSSTTTFNTTINVSGQTDGAETAREIRRQMRGLIEP